MVDASSSSSEEKLKNDKKKIYDIAGLKVQLHKKVQLMKDSANTDPNHRRKFQNMLHPITHQLHPAFRLKNLGALDTQYTIQFYCFSKYLQHYSLGKSRWEADTGLIYLICDSGLYLQ